MSYLPFDHRLKWKPQLCRSRQAASSGADPPARLAQRSRPMWLSHWDERETPAAPLCSSSTTAPAPELPEWPPSADPWSRSSRRDRSCRHACELWCTRPGGSRCADCCSEDTSRGCMNKAIRTQSVWTVLLLIWECRLRCLESIRPTEIGCYRLAWLATEWHLVGRRRVWNVDEFCLSSYC